MTQVVEVQRPVDPPTDPNARQAEVDPDPQLQLLDDNGVIVDEDLESDDGDTESG